ncbi:hypothetical protein [Rhizobium leguminosarum]|uniref:hypothetical protein n=1 Tax=Rhizobium leguminosarum TaxID=384 RepID=UPI0015DB7773|nr:hypothetical protein [Rhizobium leguminosarum]NZD50527.1 hypothetical protein [Rhizobium leguminosarum]
MTNVPPLNKRQRALCGDGENIASTIRYAENERGAVHTEKVRLHRRAQIGKNWDGTAANDNIAWPLATALIREGNAELLKAAMYYRKVHDTAKSNALLGGRTASIGDGMALDRYSYVRPNGTVTYARPKQKKSADVDIPARQYTAPPSYENLFPSSEEIKVSNWSNIPKPYKGDEPVNNMIDAQARLVQLRQRLGVLAEPLELAVVDGATYREVGNAAGIANKAGSEGAGRALIHAALVSVRDMIGNVTRSDLAA